MSATINEEVFVFLMYFCVFSFAQKTLKESVKGFAEQCLISTLCV